MNPSRISKPSGNWLSLQKRLHPHHNSLDQPRNKRQRTSGNIVRTSEGSTSSDIVPFGPSSFTGDSPVHGDTVETLRSLIFYPTPFPPNLPLKDRQPGTYVALDCEMVGVGPTGSESSLARVSVVNYFGAVLLDVFVRQKERVTDWRTQWSGIRERDMIKAKAFEEVQSAVAELIDGRILIGHAIQNDLKALMLSHPRAQIRDTQHLAHRHGQSRSARPALKNLVRDILGAKIQEGEHNSVTDARATIAIYRLYRKQWERGYNAVPIRVQQKAKAIEEPNIDDMPVPEVPQQQQRGSLGVNDDEDEDEDMSKSRRLTRALPMSKMRKGIATKREGVSSGLSTVTHHRSKVKSGVGGSGMKIKWWTELEGTGKGPKGGIRVTA